MEKTNKNTPKLRFKEFKNAPAWEQRELGDIIIEYKETVDSDCRLPVLTSSKSEGVILQEEHFGRKQQHDITGYNILPRNYCTYRNRSDGVDFTFNINKCCDMGIISKFYPVFCGNNSDVSFLSLVLNNSDEIVKEIAYTCTGTGQKVLSFLDLQKMYVRIPDYEEQKKIMTFFEPLDNLITLHQRKLDKVIALKKSYLEEMFPKEGENLPKKRFAGFTDAWEQRKLGEVVSITMGQSPNGNTYSDKPTKHVLVQGNADLNNGWVVPRIWTTQVTKMANANDLIMSVRAPAGSMGKTAYDAVIGRGVAAIKGNEFIYQLLVKMDQTKYWDVLSCGSTFSSLSSDNIKTAKIIIPRNDEQQQIGSFFNQIDHLITLHQRKLNKLKNIKQAYLNEMFI
jgi:type I restriction enzyme S subunit